MSKSFESRDTTLDVDEYLVDPPETIWKDILLLDHASWLEISDLEVVCRAQEETLEYGQDIPREAWLGLYAPSNPLKAEPAGRLQVVHGLFHRAERMPEWRRLRESSGMDPVACAFGAAHFSTELLSRLPPEIKEKMKNAQENYEKLDRISSQIDQLQNMATAMEGLPNAARENNQSSDKAPESQSQPLEEISRRLEKLNDAYSASLESANLAGQEAVDAIENSKAQVEHALAESMNASTQNLSDIQWAAQEFGMGWGAGGGTIASREHIQGLQELSDYIRGSKYVRMILEMLGWAKAVISAEKRKSKRGKERFTHFEIGELEFDSLAPQELISLIAFPEGSEMYTDFLCRALDGDLLHSRYEGEDHAGRGPIVFLRDESGSMRGWQRAIACAAQLGLMLEARKESRRFVSIPFSGQGQYQVYDPGDRPDPLELLRHLDMTYGCGTEPYAPLSEAIDIIQKDPSLKEGDILCITDGAFSSPPDDFVMLLEEARVEPGLKIVALIINGHAGQAGFADKVILVNDIFHEKEKLAEAIAAIL